MNKFLKNEIEEQGYTYETFIKKLKNRCPINTKSKLSKRINGFVKFTEDEIFVICNALQKNPCEIFFGRKFLRRKQSEEKLNIEKVKEMEEEDA